MRKSLLILIAFASVVLLHLSHPTMAEAQDGDLAYSYNCNAWMSAAGWQLAIDLDAEDDGGIMNLYDSEDGWDSVTASVSGLLAATIVNQNVGCHAYYYVSIPWEYEPSVPLTLGGPHEPEEDGYFDHSSWFLVGYAESWVTFAGAGPGSVMWYTDSFIDDQYLPAPETSIWSPVFAPLGVIMRGDERSFGYLAGGYRTMQFYEVYNPAVDSGTILNGPVSDVGMSMDFDVMTSLDPFLNLASWAKDDWVPFVPMKMFWDYADQSDMSCDYPSRLGQANGSNTSSIQMHCAAGAAYPLMPFSPEINWDYTMLLVFHDNGFDWYVDGCHDFFPNHEMYLNGNTVLRDGKETPLSLYSCSAISLSGAVR